MNDVGINNFLAPIGLRKYAKNFQSNGYDIESDFCYLGTLDLDLMGIKGERDRTRILEAATSYTNSPQFELYRWLKEYGLDHYFTNFISYGITTLHDLSKQEPSPDCLRDLEILLPGHQARLKNSLPKLRKKQKLDDAESTIPEAIGYWGKPKEIDGAKYDFLCVRATLRSLKPGGEQFNEEFMVDSGSDVVTARQELLNKLDLELIGTIQSRGVHSTVEKQLYKAMLVIGSEKVEIEIMAEPYESIGNRVMRRFKHLIDSSVHYWLPANKMAPSSSSGNSGDTSNDTPDTDEDEGSGEETTGSSTTTVTGKKATDKGKGKKPAEGTVDIQQSAASSSQSQRENPGPSTSP
ncbi:uncharacterized protein [Apostichopus japonicus]|uniref:uncharacterized protein n=1 Tax=Stichopus japonicus TaxID=307972 RepID=UPI003AB82253